MLPDAASPVEETGASTASLSWSVDAQKSRKRNHHMSVYANSFLYAIGGAQSKSTVIANVDRFPLATDGTLGAQVEDRPLPIALAGPTGGVVGNSIVVVAGGMTATGASDKSFYAAIQSDGSLGDWKTGGSVGSGRFHGGSVARGDTIWVMGGFSSVVWSDIVRAKVDSNGVLSSWEPAGQLNGPRSHFSVSLVDGWVYVAGGLDQTETNGPVADLTEVARAPIADDGTIGGWQVSTPLPSGMATHASFAWGGYLYVAGGLDTNLKIQKRVLRAPIDKEHALGDWEDVATLPIARAHVHQLPVVNNKVYSISGAIDLALDSTDTIAIGVFQ